MDDRRPHLRPPLAREALHLSAGLAAIAAITFLYRGPLHVLNPTVVSLTYLLVVLFVAAAATLRVAVLISVASVLVVNFFFLPPIGTFTIEDPENWAALVAFLVVSVVAGRLSLAARTRADDATSRRDEMARLFDLSRDILLMTDARGAVGVLARYMARRFGLDYVSVCLPGDAGWQLNESAPGVTLDRRDLDMALAAARGTLQFDAQARAYGGHREMRSAEGMSVRLVPLRLGTRAVGLLAAGGREIDPGALDAIAGLAAIAVERANLLEERDAAALIRQGDELKSALLASLGHDLRTPLTAITVAANNLEAAWLDEGQRRDQLEVILAEVQRLNRLFQNIVDLARIDTGAVQAEQEWVHASDIVEAATRQVDHALRDHALEVDAADDALIRIDPRLTSAALAHVLENAGHYAPPGTAIATTAAVGADGLTISVRDHGPGIGPRDLEHLFERFYRGTAAMRNAFGTGMGLAITRGLLAAQGGRVWAENHPSGGAVFTLVIPAETRRSQAVESGQENP